MVKAGETGNPAREIGYNSSLKWIAAEAHSL
jgi:hypothetical protein